MERKVYFDHSAFQKQNTQLKTDIPFSDEVAILGQSKEIAGTVFPNRLVCQAMEGCDGTADATPM